MELKANVLSKVAWTQKCKYCFLSCVDPAFKSSFLCVSLGHKGKPLEAFLQDQEMGDYR